MLEVTLAASDPCRIRAMQELTRGYYLLLIVLLVYNGGCIYV